MDARHGSDLRRRGIRARDLPSGPAITRGCRSSRPNLRPGALRIPCRRLRLDGCAGRFHGATGRGAGELEWAMSVSVLDDGRAYVHDGAGQIVELRMGDQAGIESAFNYAVILTSLRHVEATSRGLLIWARRRINPTGPNVGYDDWVERLLSVTGRDTVELISGKSSYRSTAYYPRCSFTFSIRRPLAPQNRWSPVGRPGGLVRVGRVPDRHSGRSSSGNKRALGRSRRTGAHPLRGESTARSPRVSWAVRRQSRRDAREARLPFRDPSWRASWRWLRMATFGPNCSLVTTPSASSCWIPAGQNRRCFA